MCKIILSSELNEHTFVKYDMRECTGIIIISKNYILVYKLYNNIFDNSYNYDEINETNIHKYGDLVSQINNYKGYWSYAIYEGDVPIINGENLLVALSDNEYIMITGGYEGPYINKFIINDIITESVYTVCSGGDPGIIFALSDEYIYTTFFPKNLCIKRNKILEQQNNIKNTIGSVIDFYLSIRGTPSRGFGYEIININTLNYIYDIEEKPLEIKKINEKIINGNYNKNFIIDYPLLNNNKIYKILFMLSKQIIFGKKNYYNSLKDCLTNLFDNLDNNSYEYKRFNNISKKINLYDMFQDINDKLTIILYNQYIYNDFNNDLHCKEHLIEFIKCYDNDHLLMNTINLFK